ncbi:hypothetical protein O181_009638 [Austropuccinia psidii MF-1]|uniref:Uncharacterized protein n=1 Tax=Austropuccinia psidii MF-1 TaxID=1389203 RepID=A0A9Q3BRF8_9BASI|nr:hypothetical protein [Austropuccinia psidii MF-1]
MMCYRPYHDLSGYRARLQAQPAPPSVSEIRVQRICPLEAPLEGLNILACPAYQQLCLLALHTRTKALAALSKCPYHQSFPSIPTIPSFSTVGNSVSASGISFNWPRYLPSQLVDVRTLISLNAVFTFFTSKPPYHVAIATERR